jgi:PAS domain-containing protein
MNWTVNLRAAHRLRVFANKALRRIFGFKREEVTEGRRKMHHRSLIIHSILLRRSNQNG